MSTPAVVIGVGNEAARDDAIGLEVIRALDHRGPSPSPARLVETDGEPARLLEAWAGAEVAVVVDAARGGVETVTVLDGLRDPLPADDRRSSHGLGLRAAIDLGRRLGRLPDRLLVVAVRGERFEPGFGLSDAARRHRREAVDVVAALVGTTSVRPPARSS